MKIGQTCCVIWRIHFGMWTISLSKSKLFENRAKKIGGQICIIWRNTFWNVNHIFVQIQIVRLQQLATVSGIILPPPCPWNTFHRGGYLQRKQATIWTSTVSQKNSKVGHCAKMAIAFSRDEIDVQSVTFSPAGGTDWPK